MLSSGGGMKQKAVFYQRSDLVDNERALLEAAIAREEAQKELARMHRTLISDSTLDPVRFVRALLALRQASIQMVQAIVQWRQIYVRGQRQVFRHSDGSNHLLRMCDDCGVLAAFHTDARFGFELSRINTFCLPTQATKKPSVEMTPELARLLRRLAEPDEEAIHEAWLVIRAELRFNKESKKPPLSVEDWRSKPWQFLPKNFVKASPPLNQQEVAAAAAAAAAATTTTTTRARAQLVERRAGTRTQTQLLSSSKSRTWAQARTESEFSTIKPVEVVHATIRRNGPLDGDDLSSITAADQHPLMRSMLAQSRRSSHQQTQQRQQQRREERAALLNSATMLSTRMLRQMYLEGTETLSTTDDRTLLIR